MLIHTTETYHPGFCKPPEPLDTVDMGAASDEFVLPVIDPKMLSIADIDQTIVSTPAIRVDDAVERDTSPDNALQRGFAAVRYISVYTEPLRLKTPKTAVLPNAPRPRLPLTRLAPK
jgi:hypothetical protein